MLTRNSAHNRRNPMRMRPSPQFPLFGSSATCWPRSRESTSRTFIGARPGSSASATRAPGSNVRGPRFARMPRSLLHVPRCARPQSSGRIRPRCDSRARASLGRGRSKTRARRIVVTLKQIAAPEMVPRQIVPRSNVRVNGAAGTAIVRGSSARPKQKPFVMTACASR